MHTLKRLWSIFLLIVAAGLLVLGGNFLILRNARGNEIVMNKAEYNGGGVRLEVYAGPEARDAHWVFIGSSDPDVAITLVAPHARGIYTGQTRSSVRNDGTFEVRIHRKHLGVFWWPEQTVRFEVPRDQLPKVTDTTREPLFEAFSARVAAQK